MKFFHSIIRLALGATLLLSNGAGSTPAYPPTSPSCDKYQIPDLSVATIDEVQQGLSCGVFTSVQLTKAYLARIAEVNPHFHAVIETNPEALSLAADLDAKRNAGQLLGPLHGIPLLVKDNIATGDEMNTTAGSYALLGAKVLDSQIASKLRKAGVIILGKSNLSQWSDYRSTNSTNGWSSRGGQCTGAYYPRMDPLTSSSGSGIAASIGLSMAALGTETYGSILGPSQRNNVVGIKPTVGLTSRHLVIPISSTQDTVGPMARTVKDAAYILSAIAGYDSRDSATSAIPFDEVPKYEEYCREFPGIQGLRIGIPRNGFFQSPNNTPEIKAFEASFSIFQKLGATVIDNANFSDLKTYQNAKAGLVTGVEFIEGIANYFASLTTNPNNLRSLQDLKSFTITTPKEEYPARNIQRWEDALALNLTTSSPAYKAALAEDLVAGSNATILGALEAYNLSALILPTTFSIGYAALAGYPVVTVPLGFYPPDTEVVTDFRNTIVTAAPNIPFGISIMGRKWSEGLLIQIAYAFEQETLRRAEGQPYLLPKAQIKDFSST